MIRKASAVWHGSLLEGNGTITTESKTFEDQRYGFKTRFENEPGTNPEELIAAAHAGCFSMALSAQLGAYGTVPTSVRTTASVTLEKLEGGFAITGITLRTVVQAPGLKREAFDAACEAAKTGCPVSKVLSAPISLEATLEA